MPSNERTSEELPYSRADFSDAPLPSGLLEDEFEVGLQPMSTDTHTTVFEFLRPTPTEIVSHEARLRLATFEGDSRALGRDSFPLNGWDRELVERSYLRNRPPEILAAISYSLQNLPPRLPLGTCWTIPAHTEAALRGVEVGVLLTNEWDIEGDADDFDIENGWGRATKVNPLGPIARPAPVDTADHPVNNVDDEVNHDRGGNAQHSNTVGAGRRRGGRAGRGGRSGGRGRGGRGRGRVVSQWTNPMQMRLDALVIERQLTADILGTWD